MTLSGTGVAVGMGVGVFVGTGMDVVVGGCGGVVAVGATVGTGVAVAGARVAVGGAGAAAGVPQPASSRPSRAIRLVSSKWPGRMNDLLSVWRRQRSRTGWLRGSLPGLPGGGGSPSPEGRVSRCPRQPRGRLLRRQAVACGSSSLVSHAPSSPPALRPGLTGRACPSCPVIPIRGMMLDASTRAHASTRSGATHPR